MISADAFLLKLVLVAERFMRTRPLYGRLPAEVHVGTFRSRCVTCGYTLPMPRPARVECPKCGDLYVAAGGPTFTGPQPYWNR